MIEVIIAKSSAIGELPALSVQVSDAGYVGRISVAEGELIRHEIRFGARTQVQSKLKKRVAGCRVRVAGCRGAGAGGEFFRPGSVGFSVYNLPLNNPTTRQPRSEFPLYCPLRALPLPQSKLPFSQ